MSEGVQSIAETCSRWAYYWIQ